VTCQQPLVSDWPLPSGGLDSPFVVFINEIGDGLVGLKNSGGRCHADNPYRPLFLLSLGLRSARSDISHDIGKHSSSKDAHRRYGARESAVCIYSLFAANKSIYRFSALPLNCITSVPCVHELQLSMHLRNVTSLELLFGVIFHCDSAFTVGQCDSRTLKLDGKGLSMRGRILDFACLVFYLLCLSKGIPTLCMGALCSASFFN
jgi:hypothetical protein